MSPKQIIVLAALGVANLCVLGSGLALLLASPAAPPAATPVAFEATVTPPPPTHTASPLPPSPRPTNTLVVRTTSEPTRTPYPTFTFLNVITPTQAPTATLGLKTPTRIPSATAPLAATARPGGGPAPTPGGGGPTLPRNRIGCGTPNGQPTNGKLDVSWSFIAWDPIPETNDVRGTIEILPSGGNDCYKYNFMGNWYDYEPITFIVRRCGSTPVNLTVTSRDGQKWSQDFIIESGTNIGFKCK